MNHQLKPIVFVQRNNKYYNKNLFQQNLLLKALTYTTDLDELKDIAKFHSKVEVLRSLDKLSIRKEYHNALVKNGLDLDYIVTEIKRITDEGGSEKVKLSALQGVLKSLGLEKYDIMETQGKNWEEILLQIHDREKGAKEIPGKTEGSIKGDYEVITPEIPEEERVRREQNKDMEKSIYE